jgi:hypothetical protein
MYVHIYVLMYIHTYTYTYIDEVTAKGISAEVYEQHVRSHWGGFMSKLYKKTITLKVYNVFVYMLMYLYIYIHLYTYTYLYIYMPTRTYVYSDTILFIQIFTGVKIFENSHNFIKDK